jgi:hypothetical protein
MLRCTIFSKRQFCESYQGHRSGPGRRYGRLAAVLTLVLSVAALSLLASPAALASQEQPQAMKPSPDLLRQATNLIERQRACRGSCCGDLQGRIRPLHQKSASLWLGPDRHGRRLRPLLPTKAAAIAEVEASRPAASATSMSAACR